MKNLWPKSPSTIGPWVITPTARTCGGLASSANPGEAVDVVASGFAITSLKTTGRRGSSAGEHAARAE